MSNEMEKRVKIWLVKADWFGASVQMSKEV